MPTRSRARCRKPWRRRSIVSPPASPVRALLGEDFFQTYLRVKSVELDLFQSVVTSWERDHLLLKV